MSHECPLKLVPKSDLVPNQPGLIPTNNQTPLSRANSVGPDNKEVCIPFKRPSVFLRWSALLFYGLFIAVIAGVIGGFLGKSITTQRMSDYNFGNSTMSEHCNATSSDPNHLNSSTSSLSPLSTPTSAVDAITIPVPMTGCTPLTTQRTFKSTSLFLAAQYNTYCATGWLNDKLLALSAAIASDCVEACVMYNGHKQCQDRTCVGGGFIPEWWNQSKAIQEIGGMPYDCFLRSNDSGTGRNNKDV